MTLLEIRKLFVERTGRYDLVKNLDTYKDSGADFYINAGQRFLDRRFSIDKNAATKTIDVKTGCNIIYVDVRIVHALQVTYQGNSYELDRVSIQDLRDALRNDLNRSKPRVFSIGISRDEQNTIQKETETAIALAPSPDTDISIKVTGVFYSNKLVKDTDFSSWSVSHPEILVHAAIMSLEGFYRNTQGYSDALTVIETLARDIEYDTIEEGTLMTDVMADSFDTQKTYRRSRL